MPTWLLFILAACGAAEPSTTEAIATDDRPASAGDATPSDDQPARYTTRGRVEELRVERRQIVLNHEAVPGYMPAMTMPFSVEDPALFEGLERGVRVEFTFSAEPGGRHVIRAIRRL